MPCPLRRGMASLSSLSSDAAVPPAVSKQVELLYGRADAPPPFMGVVCSGAGSCATSWLLGVPGASRCIAEFTHPYLRSALVDYLGEEPAQYCSASTASALAKRAYDRARTLWICEHGGDLHSLVSQPFVGVACVGSLASTRPKQSPHQAFVATCDVAGTTVHRLGFEKGARDRFAEDTLASLLLVRAIMDASGVKVSEDFLEAQAAFMDTGVDLPPPIRSPHLSSLEALVGPPLEAAAAEAMAAPVRSNVLFIPPRRDTHDGAAGHLPLVEIEDFQPRGRQLLVYPGSFNPLHHGHVELARAAQAFLASSAGAQAEAGARHVPTVMEISAANADKPMLSEEVVRQRVTQVTEASFPVAITKAPLFIDKARIFPGATFIVGADTASRILDLKYYGNSDLSMVAAIAEIAHLGCRFLVGGRVVNGTFMTLDDILAQSPLPGHLRKIFMGLSGEEFRVDLSSTEIRNASQI